MTQARIQQIEDRARLLRRGSQAVGVVAAVAVLSLASDPSWAAAVAGLGFLRARSS